MPDTEFSKFAETIFKQKYAFTPDETWEQAAWRVANSVMGPYLPDYVAPVAGMIARREFMPGGRYMYAAGRPFHQVQNCLLLDVEDSRESIAELNNRVTSALMTGAGIGVVWSKLRPRGAKVRGMGGESTGPTSFMQVVNEIGRGIMQGGSRRAAIWAGLHWDHADIEEFIGLKDWPAYLVDAKLRDFNTPAPMDMTNISVILDDAFFHAYHNLAHPKHALAVDVYNKSIEHALTTGEPGFSVDVGENAGEHLRNACTEITSADNNDICNLGSIVLPRIQSPSHMAEVTDLATAFLLCGTLYSTVPYKEVADTRDKNRRLGLGIMGFAEWLHVRGYKYEPNEELEDYLAVYEAGSDLAAGTIADELGASRPVKKRAIAPTGTISILAETTSGIEPIYASAFRRRYLKGTKWHAQYVVDSSAKRILDAGGSADIIEDAVSLSDDPARRLGFQAFVQRFVDHGISSTLNLPSAEAQPFSHEQFGKTLIDYLPSLRGVTVYPDAARGGQPLTKVDLQEALTFEGLEFEEASNDMSCVSGACGI